MATDRAPAFQFYPRDFESDGRVEAMENEEVGAYVRLLCKAWFETPVGSIPNDPAVLARWTRCSPQRWKKIAPKVLACFKEGEDGRLHQKRMGQVHATAEAYRERAKKGAKARWTGDAEAGAEHASSNAKGMLGSGSEALLEQCTSSASASASAEEDGVEERSPTPMDGPPAKKRGQAAPVDPLEEGFDDFWAGYPKRAGTAGKADALKAWRGKMRAARAAERPAMRAKIMAARDRYRAFQEHEGKIGTPFVKMASTFLGDPGNWENEWTPAAARPGHDPEQELIDDLNRRMLGDEADGGA